MYSIGVSTKKHIEYVIDNIREKDFEELYASNGIEPSKTITEAMQYSESYTWLHDDTPLALFGITDAGNGVGHPWAVFTKDATKHKCDLIKKSTFVINVFKRDFSFLYNYVSAENTLAVRWLKWLGFRMHDPSPYGPFGCMFRLFEWRSDSDV